MPLWPTEPLPYSHRHFAIPNRFLPVHRIFPILVSIFFRKIMHLPMPGNNDGHYCWSQILLEGPSIGNQFSGHRRYPLMPFLHPWAFFPVQAYFCILSPGLASFGVFRLLLRSKVHLIWSMIDSFSSLSLLSPAFGTIISLLFILG